MNIVNKSIYVHLDGDGIGDRLELLLLDDKIKEAAELSKKISMAMEEIRSTINSMNAAEIIFLGGDDVVAVMPNESQNLEKIEMIRRNFLSKTGCTISGGIGFKASEALNQLRRAKLSGKNKIVVGDKIL